MPNQQQKGIAAQNSKNIPFFDKIQDNKTSALNPEQNQLDRSNEE